jgi:hypothetical protein
MFHGIKEGFSPRRIEVLPFLQLNKCINDFITTGFPTTERMCIQRAKVMKLMGVNRLVIHQVISYTNKTVERIYVPPYLRREKAGAEVIGSTPISKYIFMSVSYYRFPEFPLLSIHWR